MRVRYLESEQLNCTCQTFQTRNARPYGVSAGLEV